MAKKFQELRDRMSPERLVKVEEKTNELLKEIEMEKTKGPIGQHKAMAMGTMPKVTGNSGKTGFEQKGGAVDGKTNIKSGTPRK